MIERTLRHGPCSGDGNGAKGLKNIRIDAKDTHFRVVGISYEANFKHIGRAGDGRERRRDKAARAAFRNGNSAPFCAVFLNYPACRRDEVLRQCVVHKDYFAVAACPAFFDAGQMLKGGFAVAMAACAVGRAKISSIIPTSIDILSGGRGDVAFKTR